MNTFHMAQIIGCLRTEINTGMRHSQGSILRLAQEMYDVKGRTKKAALAEMEDLYERRTGRRYGT